MGLVARRTLVPGGECCFCVRSDVGSTLTLTVNLLRPLTFEQESAARLDALALVGWLKVEIVWMIGYVCLAIVQRGLGLQETLGSAFLPVTLIVTGATCGYYLVRILRATRAHR